METVIDNILYINDVEAYAIDDVPTNIESVCVPLDSLDDYKELNPNIDKLKGYNYKIIKVGRDTRIEDELTIIISTETNDPVMRVMYSLGLAANPNYMTLAEGKSVVASDLEGAFRDNNEVEYFNEFKYFTNVNEVPQYFAYNATNLKEVTLPDTVTKINRNAFSCQESKVSQLRKLEGVENVERIETQALNYCFNIERLNFSANLKYIGNYNFFGCAQRNYPITFAEYSYKSLGDLSGVEEIGFNCFRNFYSPYISSLKMPNLVKLSTNIAGTIGHHFYNCSVKEIIVNENCNISIESFAQSRQMTQWGEPERLFYLEKLGSFNEVEYLPSATTTSQSDSFSVFLNDTSLKEVGDFKKLKSACYFMFANCWNLEKMGDFPELEEICSYAFENTVRIPYLYFPKVNSVKNAAFIVAAINSEGVVFNGQEVIDRTVEFGLPYEQINFESLAFKGCKKVTIICNGVELTEEQYTQLGAVKPEP